MPHEVPGKVQAGFRISLAAACPWVVRYALEAPPESAPAPLLTLACLFFAFGKWTKPAIIVIILCIFYMKGVRDNVCGKFHRELDLESLRVWPIKGFGAISQGTHRFCHTATTCEGAGQFTMVWREKDGRWQVTRVMSYDHREERVAAKGR